MGNRLTRIYTRTGDDGTTGLGDGSRTNKDGARIEALGAVDELNAVIGLLRAESLPPDLDQPLAGVQHDLFELGAELCIPGRISLNAVQVTHLEELLDHFNSLLPPLKEFILPGGTRAAAMCHVARTVCRRAERRVLALSRSEAVSSVAIHYLNRLSDLLFVFARACNSHSGVPDVYWEPRDND